MYSLLCWNLVPKHTKCCVKFSGFLKKCQPQFVRKQKYCLQNYKCTDLLSGVHFTRCRYTICYDKVLVKLSSLLLSRSNTYQVHLTQNGVQEGPDIPPQEVWSSSNRTVIMTHEQEFSVLHSKSELGRMLFWQSSLIPGWCPHLLLSLRRRQTWSQLWYLCTMWIPRSPLGKFLSENKLKWSWVVICLRALSALLWYIQ